MTASNSSRLDSLDALRGFDMFFITGGAVLLRALADALPCSVTAFLADQMTHMTWDGFAFYDMIFPLFLFLAGVSFPYSLAASRRRGLSERAVVGRILQRMLTLILLGWVFNGFLRFDFASMRYLSVLGRIGVAWGIAALCYRSWGWQKCGMVGVLVLLAYGLATALVVAPDAPMGATPTSMEGSIVGYVDRVLMPGRLLNDTFDPLGLLSTLPAVVTAWLGMGAGAWLRSSEPNNRRSLGLVTAGVLLVLVGLLLNPWLPINKSLWSSSYVCFAGGLSMLLMALFYQLIDVWGYKRWSFYFRVIGLNAITIYMAQKIVPLKAVRDFLFKGAAEWFPPAWEGVVLAVGYLLVCYWLLWFLYRHKIFLKV